MNRKLVFAAIAAAGLAGTALGLLTEEPRVELELIPPVILPNSCPEPLFQCTGSRLCVSNLEFCD